jgi:hypothetical protein
MICSMERLLAFAVLVAGCGGDAGDPNPPSRPTLDETKLLVTLTAAELDTLCSYVADLDHGPRTVTCAGGASVMLDGLAECQQRITAYAARCTATVADQETCTEHVAPDPCHLLADNGGPACALLRTCP